MAAMPFGMITFADGIEHEYVLPGDLIVIGSCLPVYDTSLYSLVERQHDVCSVTDDSIYQVSYRNILQCWGYDSRERDRMIEKHPNHTTCNSLWL